MVSRVFLFSKNTNTLNDFLDNFYSKKIELENSSSWQKEFDNPVDISELIAVFVDNLDVYNINMWITLDKNIFIKITPSNADNIIRYIFERYPY